MDNINLKSAYKEGLRNILDLITNCINIKIKYLTLFTLSSENIERQSVSNIFQVIYEDFAFFFDIFPEPTLNSVNIPPQFNLFISLFLAWNIYFVEKFGGK